MSRFKIEDFPEKVQAQIRAQLRDYSQPVAQLPRRDTSLATPDTIATPDGSTAGAKTPKAPRARKGRLPNKTETNYRDIYLRGKDARFETLTFHMSNGHRYTPDWCVFEDGRTVEVIEVKGGYALHSQQRARLAVDQGAKEFPGLKWGWAVKTSKGWEITNA